MIGALLLFFLASFCVGLGISAVCFFIDLRKEQL
jgi:hypothetical protein